MTDDYQYGEYPEQRPLYWYMEDGERKACTISFYRSFWRVYIPHCMSDEEKAEFTVAGRNLIHAARSIHQLTGGDSTKLKPISDAARREILHEVPSYIPRNGFTSADAIDYRDTLTAAEIEKRILAELKRADLLDWYELAESEEKKVQP